MAASGILDADAAPTRAAQWHGIDWAKCEIEVRKLQVRIAKAMREGCRRKVKALQWLLTHSFTAKALAVKRVTENQGKRTPGVDGVIWNTPTQKAKGLASLKRQGYRPAPLRRVYIPKSNGKLRPLGIPTMQDRAMQALHLLALEPVAETTADWNSYGFRRKRSTHDAINQIHLTLSKRKNAVWVLEGDIKGCYDHISHAWMLHNICTDTPVLAKWLKAGVIDDGKYFPTDEGAPQGSPISPTLANMVLDGLEIRLGQRFGLGRIDGNQHRQSKHKVNLIRYADDFVITGISRELLEQQVKPLVVAFLAERGLQLSEAKTRITHISEGFDFLGQHVRKYRLGQPNAKLLTKPSKKNVKTFLDKARTVIKTHRTVTQAELISLLNPMLRGWSGYHRHGAAKVTFKHVDRQMRDSIWRWIRRRHPQKSINWRYRRYFGRIENVAQVFRCHLSNERGEKWVHRLFSCSQVVIERHVKIRAAANPFDPAYEEYFEARHASWMVRNSEGRKTVNALWRRQKQQCPVCGEVITKETRWEVHWRTKMVNGGTDTQANLLLLHPDCHQQHHAKPDMKWKLPVGPGPDLK